MGTSVRCTWRARAGQGAQGDADRAVEGGRLHAPRDEQRHPKRADPAAQRVVRLHRAAERADVTRAARPVVDSADAGSRRGTDPSAGSAPARAPLRPGCDPRGVRARGPADAGAWGQGGAAPAARTRRAAVERDHPLPARRAGHGGRGVRGVLPGRARGGRGAQARRDERRRGARARAAVPVRGLRPRERPLRRSRGARRERRLRRQREPDVDHPREAHERRPVETVLDVGCGCGVQALLASRHAKSVLAVDLNPLARSSSRASTRC